MTFTSLNQNLTTLEDVAKATAAHDYVRIERDALATPPGAEANQRKASEVEGVEALLFARGLNNDLEMAVLYDAANEIYAVVSGQKESAVQHSHEHDWMVHSAGPLLSADIDPMEFTETAHPDEYVSWLLEDVIQHGDDLHVLAAIRPVEDGRFEVELATPMGLTGRRFTISIMAGGEDMATLRRRISRFVGECEDPAVLAEVMETLEANVGRERSEVASE